MKIDFYIVLSFICFLILVSILGEANTTTNIDHDQVYIVYMGASTSKKGAPRTDHVQLLNKHTERKKISVVQVYNASFLGFAALMSKEEAALLAERPGVVSVFPDSKSRLYTTRSWDFLMSLSAFRNIDSDPASSHSNVSNRWSGGRETIIGIIDGGIEPQHPSFSDEFMGPIPKHWKGICMKSTSFRCNRKVIGARYYSVPNEPSSITTAMDEDGHGTYVASIAAGTPVHDASFYGLANGIARGGSPFSRIAVYRVCGVDDCPDSSVLKAFDDAIADGVDVISASMGDNYNGFFTDPVAIGAFHAVEKGVIVVAAVGNDGPSSETITNFGPWILSVAATTMDRDFQVGIVLGGRNKVIKGGGNDFSGLLSKSAIYHLVGGRSAGYNQHDLINATHCIPGSLDGAKVKGRLILCYDNDTVDVFYKINEMIEQGVIGVILISNALRQQTFKFLVTNIAIVAVSETDGAEIQSYINSARNPLATILPPETILNHKPAPIVATSSSRGPTPGIKNLLKPDVTAPGEGILAAWRFNDTHEALPGKEPPLFTLKGGTSVSCPHVAGVAANVKSLNPTWSPSAIRSSIMTTAIRNNNLNAPITNFTGSRATPYDIGSGEISIFGPLCPGLVYETETMDYILFLCNMGYNITVINILSTTVPNNFSCPSNSSPDLISNLNYPSIAVSGLITSVKKTVSRTVTNVGQVYSTYKATVEAPAGVRVQVVPNTLQFTKKVKKQSFEVTFILTKPSSEGYLSGSITWSNYLYSVRSPFVVSHA